MSSRDEGKYAFDAFVLDVTAGLLRRGESEVELRPQIFALLCHLIVHRGELIDKRDLLDAVWPDTNVAGGSLNRAIAELRKALGDDARLPRLVETVPRRGYRFLPEVTRSAAPDPPAPVRLSPFLLLHNERSHHLIMGENVIGRAPDCHVQIFSASVSRKHARLMVEESRVSIEDLCSLNGTFVGDCRIAERTRLREFDELRIAKERLRLLPTPFYDATQPINES